MEVAQEATPDHSIPPGWFPVHLCTLANPWGHSEWLGPFASSEVGSLQWWPGMQAACGVSAKEDGVFAMPLCAFHRAFTDVDLSRHFLSQKTESEGVGSTLGGNLTLTVDDARPPCLYREGVGSTLGGNLTLTRTLTAIGATLGGTNP